MNYITEFKRLYNSNMDKDDIVMHIYLNYGSYNDNEIIFKIKKEISKHYDCDINSIKLIGSAHTGFTKIDDEIEDKDPSDFDFAIIDSRLYSKYLTSFINNNVYIQDRKTYYSRVNNVIKGKIHPLYEGEYLKNELNKINKNIQDKLNLDKKISICFYISEFSLINNLSNYFSSVLSKWFKEDSNNSIEQVSTISGINKL